MKLVNPVLPADIHTQLSHVLLACTRCWLSPGRFRTGIETKIWTRNASLLLLIRLVLGSTFKRHHACFSIVNAVNIHRVRDIVVIISNKSTKGLGIDSVVTVIGTWPKSSSSQQGNTTNQILLLCSCIRKVTATFQAYAWKKINDSYPYVDFPAQLRWTMLIFLDSGLYSPRPSKPTPMKAAPSIIFCLKRHEKLLRPPSVQWLSFQRL